MVASRNGYHGPGSSVGTLVPENDPETAPQGKKKSPQERRKRRLIKQLEGVSLFTRTRSQALTVAGTVLVPSKAGAVPAVAISDLCRVFGKKRQVLAVDHLSLQVQQGEIFGLLGRNGSGKTTTINMISGLIPPSSGSISVLGYDIHRDIHRIRQLLGTVHQETALYRELSAWANMEFHAALYDMPGHDKKARIARLLDLVQLLHRKDERVANFSGGMQRRLAIARALLHDPLLVYLDEPTLGVDPQARAAIWEYIRDLPRQGKTVLLTTNYLEEAQALCSRLAIIHEGRLITVDTPDRLRQIYGGSVISIEVQLAAGAQALALDELRRLDGVREVSLEPPGSAQGASRLPVVTESLLQSCVVRVITRGARTPLAEVVNLLSRQGEITDIANRESNLDEVFLQLTGTALRD